MYFDIYWFHLYYIFFFAVLLVDISLLILGIYNLQLFFFSGCLVSTIETWNATCELIRYANEPKLLYFSFAYIFIFFYFFFHSQFTYRNLHIIDINRYSRHINNHNKYICWCRLSSSLHISIFFIRCQITNFRSTFHFCCHVFRYGTHGTTT